MSNELPIKVLLVLPDEKQFLPIESGLAQAGFDVSIAMERQQALRLMNQENPQFLIMDSEVPHISDMILYRTIRAELNLPETNVIVLCEEKDGPDMPPALERGADASLLKPFRMEELLTIIVALQSRHPERRQQRTITVGAIEMIPEQWLVYVAGEPVNLTEKEYRLLQELMEVRGQVLTRETLLERVWGHQKSYNLHTRTLDVHMSRLRTKLGSSAANIITVRNVGYRMNWPLNMNGWNH